jgi:hypothetical protein
MMVREEVKSLLENLQLAARAVRADVRKTRA